MATHQTDVSVDLGMSGRGLRPVRLVTALALAIAVLFLGGVAEAASQASPSPVPSEATGATIEQGPDLDGLVTKTYDLDGVNDGYDDMRAGKNIRGVMVYS